jgi:hypothetical protein
MTPNRCWVEALVIRFQSAFLENPFLELTIAAAQR